MESHAGQAYRSAVRRAVSMIRKKTVVLTLGTFILAAAAFLQPLRFIDNLWYDLHFSFAASDAGDQTVVVGIDPESIECHGALPWKRSMMADLVERIGAAKPKAIALDFLFPRREGTEDNDSLAAVFSRTSPLVLPFRAEGITLVPRKERSPIHEDIFVFRVTRIINPEKFSQVSCYSAKKVSAADTLFIPYAAYGGFLNVSTSNTSQKIREAIQVIRVGDEFFPSFGIAAVAAYCGISAKDLVIDGNGYVLIGEKKIPISTYAASTAINFRNEQVPVKVLSAAKVLDGTVRPSDLSGKLVFVGVTDPAAGADFFSTPVGSQVPGVVVWANLSLDILENRVLHRTSLSLTLLSIVIMFFLFPGLAIIFPSSKRTATLLLGISIIAASLFISMLIFKTSHAIWHFPEIVYAWFFSLLWLAALRADPTLAGPVSLKLELAKFPDDAYLPPPTEDQMNEKLPKTDTTDFITKIFSSYEERERDSSEPETLSGTMVEVQREELAAKPRSQPMIKDLDAIPRDIADGKIVKLLGTGGMADVYLVWHPRLETYRAVKVLKPHCSENFVSRFETEIRIIAKLDHPNIVHCYSVGEWHSLPYLEMEYVHGASMEEVLKRGNVTVEQALIIGIMVSRALHYAHNHVMSIYGKTYRGIIHRDLKPANIMLGRGGQIKLTDFGIARPETVSLHTVDAGSVVGTLPYLAPEQLERNEFTASVDIYALGTTLYELIAGERVFPQTEIPALLRAKSIGTFRPLVKHAQVSEEVAAVIEKAMALEAGKRHPRAQSFGMELERVLYGMAGSDAASHLEGLVRRLWGNG